VTFATLERSRILAKPFYEKSIVEPVRERAIERSSLGGPGSSSRDDEADRVGQ
jgi:hypothetical protein